MLREINQTIHPSDEMFNFMKKKGEQSEEGYFKSGENTVNAIIKYIQKLRPSIQSNKKVLDYGCAHGRITRHIQSLLKPSFFVGADVWGDAVEFCSKQFGTKPFVISNENPISNLEELFDIVIAISVFSHLSSQKFQENLKAISLSLSDEGLFFFTTKGDKFRIEKNLTLKDGYFFGAIGKAANHTDGRLTADEYGFMCVTKDFVEEQLKKAGLSTLYFKEVGIGRQDLFIVEKAK